MVEPIKSRQWMPDDELEQIRGACIAAKQMDGASPLWLTVSLLVDEVDKRRYEIKKRQEKINIYKKQMITVHNHLHLRKLEIRGLGKKVAALEKKIVELEGQGE